MFNKLISWFENNVFYIVVRTSDLNLTAAASVSCTRFLLLDDICDQAMQSSLKLDQPETGLYQQQPGTKFSIFNEPIRSQEGLNHPLIPNVRSPNTIRTENNAG